MCSLLQPIVLRDVLHVVRHGALHIFRALLLTASADMVSCLPSIWFLSLQQLAEPLRFCEETRQTLLNRALLHTRQIGTRAFLVFFAVKRGRASISSWL